MTNLSLANAFTESKLNSHVIVKRMRLSSLLALAALLVFWYVGANAQTTQQTTPRGVQAGNSYSISDIETINTTSGNLMLNIPLAKLPAGRAGLSAGISLMYNSKLWDLNTYPSSTGCSPIHSGQGCEPNNYELRTIKSSDDGGWRYAVGYEITNTGVGHPMTGTGTSGPSCSQQVPGNWSMPGIKTPDGSRHELRMAGSLASYDWYDDGSFPFLIDGTPLDTACRQEAPNRPATNSVLTYFTIDGSFMRVDVTVGAANEYTWVLYLPDGSRVTGSVAAGTTNTQRTYDRNGNYLDLIHDSNYNSTGKTVDRMVDQLGRELKIEYATDPVTPANRDTITMTGFNGATLTWYVHWKTIYVNQKYIKSYPGNTAPSLLVFERTKRVVESIDLPEQLGDLQYLFTYSGNNTDYQSPFTAALGWGEVNSVTTPLGAKAEYEYKRDTPGTNLGPIEILNNFPVKKTLTYLSEYDGSSSTVSEVWNYDYDFGDNSSAQVGWSTVTGPDGGVTRQEFKVTGENPSSPVGEPFRTTNPDGTVIERIWNENLPAATFNHPQWQFVNPYVKTEFTTIKNYAGTAVLTAIKDMDYDKNGNVTKVKEYDFVAASTIPRDSFGLPNGIPSGVYPSRVSATGFHAETPAATDHTTSSDYAYYATANGGAPRFLQAALWSEVRSVSGGSETTVSRTEITYDNALTTGNATLVRNWDNYKGGSFHAVSTPLTDSNSNKV
ncbi:MAG: hypothetical protein ABIZ95_14920, partial [Pyrinomonadaceae bacterium]